MKLNEQQLMRLNRAYYEAELAGITFKEKTEERNKMVVEIQKETGSNFSTWNAATGETDYVESTAVEVIPPRKRKK